MECGWGLVFDDEAAALPYLWGMGYGRVENVAILVAEMGFDTLYERVCFSHSVTSCN